MKNHIDSFFYVNSKFLDKYQRKVVLCNDKELLVVAAAGSGKTLTIVGKIKYLIEKMGYNEKEILCLSFTNETVNSLRDKIPYNVDAFTFHKLSLNIINERNKRYFIANDELLEYVVDEFFNSYLSFDYLSIILEYFEVLEMDDIYKSGKLDILKYNIIAFIKKIKCNNIGFHYLKRKIKKVNDNKDKIFLIIALEIYYLYDEELKSSCKIDFDDMIIYAKDLVKKFGIKRKYKYIIIDEYQDISLIRFNLIWEIKKYLDCYLMCVGDDYQSIYGFSGSNVSLFINFFKYYPCAKRLDIKNTYRNCYELIKITRKFIMKNPYQLRKSIYATHLLKYPIVLVYYDDFNKTYDNLINYLYLENKMNLMVLSRYNRDLEKIKRYENNMNINYLTVHRSKGLECDNVILLNMSDNYLGFPSKIGNRDILGISSNDDDYLYAEERRLFYVALTRCKEKIYILVPRCNPSIFIKEIKHSCIELIFT